jgi:ribosomal protein S18 acetylase RimI-like enzyme
MSISFEYTLDRVDWDELVALYAAAALGQRDPAVLKETFGNSRYTCLVREGDRLVGAGRALADGGDTSYICDVALLPSHQGQGLGRALVARLIELSRGHRKILLYSVRGKEPFYRKFGFLPMTTAMALFEDQAGAVLRGMVTEG